MVGTLLEDIASGMPYEDIKRRWVAKMHPLQYQRPQAAPSAGNIAQAEKLVEQMGVRPSLERRYARLEDIQPLWTPTPAKPSASASNGVFGHLLPQANAVLHQLVNTPAQKMTWVKFEREVLPTAKTIAFAVPAQMQNYSALVTAVHPDAPLIFQWDNPVNAYMYHGGSSPQNWNLKNGWCPVTAVTLQPFMWGTRTLFHQGEGVIFILEGAYDTRGAGSGMALFPETLRSAFHGIRSTIEAFSQNGSIAEREQATACGISLQKGGGWGARFRVIATNGITAEYVLDRWD